MSLASIHWRRLMGWRRQRVADLATLLALVVVLTSGAFCARLRCERVRPYVRDARAGTGVDASTLVYAAGLDVFL